MPTLRTIARCSPLLRQISRKPLILGASRSLVTSRPSFKDGGKHASIDQSIEIQHPPIQSHPRDAPARDTHIKHVKPTLPSFSLEGGVAVVTGGARGLGLVMAQAILQSGSDLALVDLSKDEAEKQAKNLVEQFHQANPDVDRVPKVTAHYSDVANPESVDSTVADVISQHGKIDHLVTSAGFTENFEAINYPIDRVRKLWSVNVDGTYLYANAVARHLIERKSKGSMVFIGSMSGAIVNVPQPQAPYNASKAAVRHLASSLAVEWAGHGIRVNVIAPGYMRTALTKKIIEDNPALYEKWISLIPTGKMGVPEDLMGAVVFLLSNAAGYVNGAELRVDGAYTVT